METDKKENRRNYETEGKTMNEGNIRGKEEEKQEANNERNKR